MTLRTEVLTVTPERATKMLATQTNVRVIRKAIVTAYATSMRAGAWALTGEPIQTDPHGRLLNGFHRLRACIEAATPFTTVLVSGVEAEAVWMMDSGRTRSVADSLGEHAIANATTVSAAGRASLMWGRGVSLRSYVTVSRSELVQYIRDNEAALVDAATAAHVVYRAVGGWAAIYAVVYMRANPAFRDTFFNAVATGANLPEGDPRLALRQWIVNTKSNGIRRNHAVALSAIVRAWNAWIDGRSLSYIKTNTDTVPVLHPGPTVEGAE